MKLLIQSATANLEDSIDFFEKLKFVKLNTENNLLFTDSNYIVDINPNRYARTGIKLYKDSWKDEIEALKELVNIELIENHYQFTDPSGTWVYLHSSEAYPQYAPVEDAKSILGNLMGISTESSNMPLSIQVWETLGFKINMGDPKTGWVSMMFEDKFGISIMKSNMCPHLFFNPSLTYFNAGKNLEIIEEIKKSGVPIYEEIRVFNKENIVDNVLLREKGGLGFFVFND